MRNKDSICSIIIIAFVVALFFLAMFGIVIMIKGIHDESLLYTTNETTTTQTFTGILGTVSYTHGWGGLGTDITSSTLGFTNGTEPLTFKFDYDVQPAVGKTYTVIYNETKTYYLTECNVTQVPYGLFYKTLVNSTSIIPLSVLITNQTKVP